MMKRRIAISIFVPRKTYESILSLKKKNSLRIVFSAIIQNPRSHIPHTFASSPNIVIPLVPSNFNITGEVSVSEENTIKRKLPKSIDAIRIHTIRSVFSLNTLNKNLGVLIISLL
jgi:hypothetical protein